MDNDYMLEFRDGMRSVPEHLVDELKQLETYKMTYRQALAEADANRQRRWLGDVQHKVIFDHMSSARRGY